MELVLLVAPLAILMLAIEGLAPRDRVASPRWYPRALAFSALQVGVAYLGASAWQGWLPAPSWSGQLPFGVDVGIGYLTITFVYYWWHRARHEVPWLWRSIHQLHQSPVRLEVFTSFYKHPAEMLLNGLLSSLILTTLVGLDAKAATVTVAITAIAEFFYHWNVRTPYWVEFLVQRPEMHCVHHERGVHTSNFSDLPLWDWLFGTWRNPRERSITCGFEGQGELQLRALLMGQEAGARDAQRDGIHAHGLRTAAATARRFSS